MKIIYREEGIRAFSKGIGPRMCMNIPSCAISWGTYEIAKGFLIK
jgi:Mitochondrial carrier protein